MRQRSGAANMFEAFLSLDATQLVCDKQGDTVEQNAAADAAHGAAELLRYFFNSLNIFVTVVSPLLRYSPDLFRPDLRRYKPRAQRAEDACGNGHFPEVKRADLCKQQRKGLPARRQQPHPGNW